ncbi:hypothetical protein [Halorussus litoreus]|uniref:hypothetical protein n=1 Tax=Halorussus litoreus TaxID=1710536 RepID=UPI000E24F8BA|nr:hypothetical protein [Halorussus litoreus]
MEKRTAALAVLAVSLATLVVFASLGALVPASATDDPAAEAPPVETPPIETPATGTLAVTDRTPPELPEQWQETDGGDGDDTFADLVRTPDGGYLAVGWTERDGNDDGWLVKIDGEGNEQWSKTLGDSGTDRFWGVAETDDGYLLAGRSDEDGGQNGWVVEIGFDGEVVRERTVGAGAFYALARDDGGVGESGDPVSNESGTPSDAGYLLAGMTYGSDGNPGWLLKLDGDHEEAWRTTVSTPDDYGDGRLRAIVPTDSGYYLAGKAVGDSDDGWALNVDAEGETEWATTVGGPGRDDVWAAASVSSTTEGASPEDDGFVLAGETESDSEGPRDGWLVKFGPEGEVEWERSPGGEGTQWLDSAMRTDDGFLFTGSSNQGPHGSADGYVLATDESGETRWESYYGTAAWDKPWPAIRAHGGGYLLAGKTTMGSDDGDGDGWLLRIGDGTDGAGGGGTTGAETTGETATVDGETSEAPATDRTTSSGDTTAEAMQGETPTASDAPGAVPGFGVGAALIALLVLGVALLAVRR